MTPNTITEILQEIYQQCQPFKEGAVASYIPELTKANPEWYGIAIVTADGYRYCIGDTEQDFTIQSISKAFTFGLALDDLGEDKLKEKVGVEPSGNAFNEISLDPVTGRPSNPMINAGAIATVGQTPGQGLEERFERIRKCYSAHAGRELAVDELVYASESATGFRNRAIAYLLRNSEIIQDPVDENCELYFKQCSLLINCLDLASMGATLANNGVNPITGERALQEKHVSKVLSVMGSCGMYNGSGEWIYQVGLPSKSGVGGGVLGVLPGQMGIAVFSPRLDPKGNSVRGVKTFKKLSQHFGLHMLNLSPLDSSAIIRSARPLCDIESNQARPQEEVALIRQYGDEVLVIEAQGNLFFGTMERIVRMAQQDFENALKVILDLSRVGQINRAFETILWEFSRDLAQQNKILHLIDPQGLVSACGEEVGNYRSFCNREEALEEAESSLLEKYELPQEGREFALAEFDVFSGFEAHELELIEELATCSRFEVGDFIIREGSEADAFFLLSEGLVGIFISEEGERKRIRRVRPGVSFGDIALVEAMIRSIDAVAEKPSLCLVISKEAFLGLEREHPVLFSKLLKNLLRINTRLLRENTRQLAILRTKI